MNYVFSSVVNKENLTELRNKVIQFYQTVLLIESGGISLEESIEKMKGISRFMMDSIDAALEDYSDSKARYDEVYNSFFKPIEVNPETLSKIKDYLEPYKLKNE